MHVWFVVQNSLKWYKVTHIWVVVHNSYKWNEVMHVGACGA